MKQNGKNTVTRIVCRKLTTAQKYEMLTFTRTWDPVTLWPDTQVKDSSPKYLTTSHSCNHSSVKVWLHVVARLRFDYVTAATTAQLRLDYMSQQQPQLRHRVRTDIKTLFSRTFQDLQLDQIPGFSRTQKTRFQGLSRIHSIHKHGCMRSKRAHTKSVFNVTALQ